MAFEFLNQRVKPDPLIGLSSVYPTTTQFGSGVVPVATEAPVATPEEEEGYLAKFARVMSDPSVMGSMQVFSAAMAGDPTRMQNAQTAYLARQSEIRQQKAQEMQRALERKQQLEDIQSGREFQTGQQYTQSLYSQYTPESVLEYQNTGDASKLVKPVQEITPYQQSQLDLQRQQMEQQAAQHAATLANQRATTAASKPVTQVVDGVLYQYDSATGQWGQVAGEPKKTSADIKAEEGLKVFKGQATKNYATAENTLKALETIGDKDVANVGGWSATGGMMTPGSKASAQKFNQVLSQQFMQNIPQLSGMGALSNAEGSKVTAAATALVDPETNSIRLGLSEDFVKSQLKVLKEGAKNLQKLSEFHQKFGREPTIEEYTQIQGGDTGTSPQTTTTAPAMLTPQSGGKVRDWNDL